MVFKQTFHKLHFQPRRLFLVDAVARCCQLVHSDTGTTRVDTGSVHCDNGTARVDAAPARGDDGTHYVNTLGGLSGVLPTSMGRMNCLANVGDAHKDALEK